MYVCLLSYGLSSIIGYIGLVGISWRAGSCTYWRLCVSAAWSAGPVRVYLVALLGWVAGRYRFPVLFGFVLACVRVIEQVGGVAGRYDFFVFLLALAGRYDWNCEWVLYLNFHFLQFAVNCLSGWTCAVGILCYSFCSIWQCLLLVPYYSTWWLLIICCRRSLRTWCLEEGQEFSAHARDTWTWVCRFGSENWTPESCCRLFDATKTVKLSGPRLGWLLWHLTALLFDSFEAENVVL